MYQYQIEMLDENLMRSAGPLLFDANEVLTFLKSQPKGEMGEIQVWITDEIQADELHDEDDWGEDRRPDFRIMYVVTSSAVRLSAKADLIRSNHSAVDEPIMKMIIDDGIKLSRNHELTLPKSS